MAPRSARAPGPGPRKAPVAPQARTRRSNPIPSQPEAILDACPTALVTVDVNGVVSRVNAAGERLLGVAASLVGRPLHDVVHPFDAAGDAPDGTAGDGTQAAPENGTGTTGPPSPDRPSPNGVQAATRAPRRVGACPGEACPFAAGGPADPSMGDLRVLLDGARSRVLAFDSSPIVEGGARTGTVLSLRDVTSERGAEARLRASAERLPILSRATNDVVYDWDAATDRMWFSENLAPIYGWNPEALEREPQCWSSRVHPEDLPAIHQSLQAAIAGDATVWQGEYRWRKGDKSYAHSLDRAYILRDHTGKCVRIIGAIVDLTAQRKLEAELRHSQKMDALGRLAGGVAHDFNNLLTVILTQAEYAELGDDVDVAASFQQIKQAAMRAASLTRQLLAFSRKQAIVPRVIHVNDHVIDMKKMLRRLIGEHIELETSLAADLAPTLGDPGCIEQVILNLVVNSRDAMPDGGRIRIGSANVELDEAYCATHPDASPGPHVMLSVTDTGCGMDADTMARIFEPFFTTKGEGKGTGLGLSIVYGVVKQFGGTVHVYSEVGLGTTFKLYFPLAPAAATTRAAAPVSFESLQGSGVLLLVEDEEGVRAAARGALTRFGYTVLAAGSPREALALLEGSPKEPDLLITDMVLPGMSGRDLAEVVLRRRPGTRLLFMSGYSDISFLRRGEIPEGTAFIEKPFTLASLAAKVKEVLTAAPEDPSDGAANLATVETEAP